MKTDKQRREELFERMKAANPSWSQIGQLYLQTARDMAVIAVVPFVLFSALDAFAAPLSMQDWLAQFVIVLPVTWWVAGRLSSTLLDRTEALVQQWEQR